jgi:hypothetical protein
VARAKWGNIIDSITRINAPLRYFIENSRWKPWRLGWGEKRAFLSLLG